MFNADANLSEFSVISVNSSNATYFTLAYGTIESRRVREIGQIRRPATTMLSTHSVKSIQKLEFYNGKQN